MKMNVKEYILVPRSVYEGLVNRADKIDSEQKLKEPTPGAVEEEEPEIKKPHIEIENHGDVDKSLMGGVNMASEEEKVPMKSGEKPNEKNSTVRRKKQKQKVKLANYNWLSYP